MTRRLLIAGAALAVAAGCDVGGPEPNVSLERMLYQPKYDPYEENEFFADDKAMRTPPAGTVHRARPLAPALVVQGFDGDGWATEIPLSIDRSALARGRERFDIYCAVCHGRNGDGSSAVARSMALRPPTDLAAERIRSLPPGRIFHAVTTGYGFMPGYGDVLSVEERWAVVAYLQALQLSRGVPLAELPPPLRERGRRALAPVDAERVPAPPRGEERR